MRAYFFICLLCAVSESQILESNFLPSWFRVAKSANIRNSTVLPITSEKTKITTAMNNETTTQVATSESADFSTTRLKNKSTTGAPTVSTSLNSTNIRNMIHVTTHLSSPSTENSTVVFTTTTTTEGSTGDDTTFLEFATTEELRDLSRTHEFYLTKRNKPQIKISTNISQVSEFLSKKKTKIKHLWFPSKRIFVWNLDTFRVHNYNNLLFPHKKFIKKILKIKKPTF